MSGLPADFGAIVFEGVRSAPLCGVMLADTGAGVVRIRLDRLPAR